MNAELERQLHIKYPKIFVNIDIPSLQSVGVFGLACGDGWFNLIDRLCRHLQWNTDFNNYPQVVACQVKEKFGGLRFYTDGGNVEQHAAISFAESLSRSICEDCGAFNDTVTSEGIWVTTKCSKCRIIK